MGLCRSSKFSFQTRYYLLSSFTPSLKVNKETSKVVLNSLFLDLDQVSLHSDALHVQQEPSSKEFDPVQQRVVFTFADALPADSTARLTIAFKAAITGHMMGYYKSTGGADGKTIYALTQFQVSGIDKLDADAPR